MKKLIVLLFIISTVVPISFASAAGNQESLNASSIVEEPDFRGVWKVMDEGQVSGFQIIWKDEKGDYQALYMDNSNDVTTTLEVYMEEDKLVLKTIFYENNWRITEVLTMEDKNTILVEGVNEMGSYTQTLKRVIVSND